MSRYLIDRIAATPNIELMTQTEIVALDGAPGAGLERVRWRDRARRAPRPRRRSATSFCSSAPIRRPTGCEGCGVALDKAGFVVTGAPPATGGRPPLALESSVPGVFAVGDVRSGSVKRVGGAIGEGAQVVAAIHNFLAHFQSPDL